MDKHLQRELIMHFWFNVFYVMNIAAGAVVIELAARGMRWLGVSDFSYYLLSGVAHLMLAVDIVLLVAILYFSARNLLRKVTNETQS
jgi:hypothetical protein